MKKATIVVHVFIGSCENPEAPAWKPSNCNEKTIAEKIKGMIDDKVHQAIGIPGLIKMCNKLTMDPCKDWEDLLPKFIFEGKLPLKFRDGSKICLSKSELQ